MQDFISKAKGWKNMQLKKTSISSIDTFSPAEVLVLPSASLADRAPVPIDGKTVDHIG